MAPLKRSLACYQQPTSNSMHPNPNQSTQLQRALLAGFRISSLPLGFEPRTRISTAPNPSPIPETPPSSSSSFRGSSLPLDFESRVRISTAPSPIPETPPTSVSLSSLQIRRTRPMLKPRARISTAPSPSPGPEVPPSSYSSEGMQGWADQPSPYTTSSEDDYLYSRSNSVTTTSNKGKKKKWKPQAVSYDTTNDPITILISTNLTLFTISRSTAIRNSRVLASFFDPETSLSDQYCIPDTTPEFFRLWLEYVHQAPDEGWKRVFPRTIYLELEKRLRDEERRGVDGPDTDSDSDTDMYSDWPPPSSSSSSSSSNPNHHTPQTLKTTLLTTLFALHSLAAHLQMSTLQNDTILQIISASHKYHILPTWDMLEPCDSYHLESEFVMCDSEGEGKGRIEDRPMRRLLVDLWVSMAGEEGRMEEVEDELKEWPRDAVGEFSEARERARGEGMGMGMGMGMVEDEWHEWDEV